MSLLPDDLLEGLSEKELLALQLELEDELFVRRPVSCEEFLSDPFYLGDSAKALYPKVKQQIIKFQSNPDIIEVIFAGSIGWGKSYGTTVSLAYDIYKLSCLKNPLLYFGLSPDSEIAMINTATTGATAKTTIYGSLKSMIDNSEYFKTKFPRDSNLESTLKFPNKISFYAGNSSELGALGQNVFSAVIDEANFLEAAKMSKVGRNVVDDANQATVLYNALQRRLKSRFLNAGKVPGKIYLVSSAVHPKDFISRKIEQAGRSKDRSVHVIKFAQWETKPEGTYSGETFKVMVGNELIPSKILNPGEEREIGEEFQVIDVPMEYYKDFDNDIAGSLRDIAGVGVSGKNKFISNGTKVKACLFEEYDNPVHVPILHMGLNDEIGAINKNIREEELRAIRTIHPKFKRYIHVDMAVKGDRLALAMAHPFLFEGRHKIRTDLLINIQARKGDEIPLHHIRHFILDLRDKYGFEIARVSFDQFQSVDSQQILKKAHFEVDQLSVDRTAAPYKTLKTMIYAEDIEMYNNDMLIRELMDLEHDVVKDKIDHPLVGSDGLPGSKDLADGLAGTIASIAMDYDMSHYDHEKQMAIIDMVAKIHKQEMLNDPSDTSWLNEDNPQETIDNLRNYAKSLGANAAIREIDEGILVKVTYLGAQGQQVVRNRVVEDYDDCKDAIDAMLRRA